jgi:hypothetical protein
MTVVSRDPSGPDGSMAITSVTETDRTDSTYNLTVADFETYFVGKQRVLVHNCKHPDVPAREKGERFKSTDNAEQQFQEIDKAQSEVRKGKSNQIIDSTKKSEQRANNANNELTRGNLGPEDMIDPDLIDD